MVRMFKKLWITQIVFHIFLIIVVTVGCVLFLIDDSFNALFNYIVVAFLLCLFISKFIFELTADLKHNKIISILNDECNPARFIEEYTPFLNRHVGEELRCIVLANIMCGYCDAGDIANASRVYNALSVCKPKKAPNKVILLSDFAILHINEGRIDMAQSALAAAKNILETEKIKGVYLEQCKNKYNMAVASMNVERGEFGGVEEMLCDMFENVANLPNLAKVGIKYLLGIMYQKQGRLLEAYSALDYTAKHGGTLEIKREAELQCRGLEEKLSVRQGAESAV